MTLPPRAILFDLDGTLVDSEPLHRRAILDTFHALGVDRDTLDPREFVGRGERDFWAYARERYGLARELEDLIEQKDARYAELARTDLRATRGARECLERFAATGLPLAIASGSSPRSIAASVSAVGIGHFFRELVSSLDPECARSKPHPDVFLLAARRLTVEPSRCVVVEDAEWGIRAANAAAMRVVVIPNEWTLHQDLSGADRTLGSLDELDHELLGLR